MSKRPYSGKRPLEDENYVNNGPTVQQGRSCLIRQPVVACQYTYLAPSHLQDHHREVSGEGLETANSHFNTPFPFQFCQLVRTPSVLVLVAWGACQRAEHQCKSTKPHGSAQRVGLKRLVPEIWRSSARGAEYWRIVDQEVVGWQGAQIGASD